MYRKHCSTAIYICISQNYLDWWKCEWCKFKLDTDIKHVEILKDHHYVMPSKGSQCSKFDSNTWFISQGSNSFNLSPNPPNILWSILHQHFSKVSNTVFFPVKGMSFIFSWPKKVCSHWLSLIIIVSISGVERVSVVWVFGASWCFNCTHTLWSLQASQYPTTRLL